MALASWAQTSFLGGAWSVAASGEWADPKYKTALGLSQNGYPMETGGWVRRSGTMMTGPTRQGNPGRVIPFNFEESQPYSMEFTDGYVRFWLNGNTLTDTGDSVGVTSISTATPAVMTIPTARSWVANNSVYFTGVANADPQLLNRRFLIIKSTNFIYSLYDEITGVALNGALLQSISVGLTVHRVAEGSTVYLGQSWLNLRSIAAENQTVLVHTAFPPQMIIAAPSTAQTSVAQFLTNPGQGSAGASITAGIFGQLPAGAQGGVNFSQGSQVQQPGSTFLVTPAVLADGPYLDPFTNGAQVTPNQTSGIIQ